MNENLKNKNIIFCDLDGTLIETISGETFPKGIWDMRIKFDVLDAIKKLNPEYILIVSNQGGIESGFVDRDDFRSKYEYITRVIREYCGCECYGMYCSTNDKLDLYRKPNTGILENLMERYVGDDFDYIKQKSLMIGDASGKEGQFSDSDKKTAENFGIDYMDVNDFVKTLLNENLNLVEILKDCPRGTKLYSIMWGEVELEKLNVDRIYPIVVKTKTKQSNIEDLATFTSSGMWSSEYNGECMLFPSKDQRDWSKFKPKKTIEKNVNNYEKD